MWRCRFRVCRSNLLLLFLILNFLTASKSLSQSPHLDALVNGIHRDLPAIYIPNLEKFPFIGIQDLADVLDVRTYYSEKARKVILYFNNIEVKVTAMNPFVMVGNKIIQLPIEPRYANGDIYVPMPIFLNVVKPLFQGTIRLVTEEEKVTVAPEVTQKEPQPVDVTPPAPAKPEPKPAKAIKKQPNLQGVQIDEKTNGTLIRIKTNTVFESSHINSRITRGWLYIDVYGGRVDPKHFQVSHLGGIVRKVVPVQLSQMAQISFRLRGEITSRKVYVDQNSMEILVSLATKEQVSEDVLKSLESEKRKWLIDTIIIDPGHGGRDPGAIGPTGVKEKDVTLAIARYLKKLLTRKSHARVILTREDDRFVPLNDRTRLANYEQGKLFVSIHANSNRSARVNGITTYFLGPAKTEEALEVSKRENAVINYEKDHSAYADYNTENYILLTLAQNVYLQESQELAALVQSEVTKRVKIKNRGVKQAGYYVLIGASMPNILIEVAFISNKREEKLLRTPQFQRKVAEAICESILKFKKKYEKEI